MYAIHVQTDPPTVVDEVRYCRLLNLQDYQLVLAGGNYLRIYQITPNVSGIDENNEPKITETRLECLFSIRLFGNVTSMSSCLISGHERECLVLAFDEAKVSFLQFDPDVHDFKTVSLHCYEDEVLRGGFTQKIYSPQIDCDPENRCCAALVYGTHLAVMPLMKDSGNILQQNKIGPYSVIYQIAGFLDDDEPTAPATGPPKVKVPAQLSTPSTANPNTIGGGGSTIFPLGIQSYTVPLNLLDEKLQNVADMRFLYGYYEPTLLFLYEPIPTTSGRVAVRNDTYCILAVSLNTKEQTNAVIWSLQQLPYDLFRIQPVPKPIGGVLVFGANCVVYLNQSVPPYGIVVNGNMKDATSFPLKGQEEKQLSLESSSSSFIDSRTLVVCLKTGDLYVLTLLVDNLNIVKAIHLDKAASSVIASACCRCDEGLVFLASRLGNSILLRYWERNSYALKVDTVGEQLPPVSSGAAALGSLSKRARMDELAVHDDVDIYGEVVAVRQQELMTVVVYGFEVCDSLLNIAPCRSMAFGEASVLPEEVMARRGADPFFDMVIASGHAKNGAVSILHRSVRPNIITSSMIPNASQLWTVGRASDELEGAQRYLLISKEVDTMVLEMKEEITELEESGFEMNQKTVAAGDVGNGEFVIQVTPMSIILLKDAQKVQLLPLETSFPVAQASIVDPYVGLLLDNGELLLAVFYPSVDGERAFMALTSPQIHQPIPATTISVYKDASGLFTTQPSPFPKSYRRGMRVVAPSGRITRTKAKKEEGIDPAGDDDDAEGELQGEPFKINITARQPVLSEEVFQKTIKPDMTIDDEDDLLYGDAPAVEAKPNARAADAGFKTDVSHGPTPHVQADIAPPNTFWLFVCRENGLLEIFALPTFKLVYMIKRFPFGHKSLYDTDPIKLALEADRPSDEYVPPVKEILVTGLGANKARPYLFAMIDQELAIYEAFPYHGSDNVPDHLRIRFTKLYHDVVPRNQRHTSLRQGVISARDNYLISGASSFHYFENVGGYGGVFLAGPYPTWLVMTPQGILRSHPMNSDGSVSGFAEFHNINCHRGFIYINMETRHMRICQLQPNVSYDSSCPMQKVNLKCTVHFLLYLLDSKTYALAISNRKPCQTVVTLLGDEKQFEKVDKSDPNFVYPVVDEFVVQLYAPESWEPIPDCKIELEQFEHVTVMKEVQLKSEGTTSGYQSYLAFGTIWNYGEECLIRGRIFICEVIDVVPEPGQPLSRHKIKVLYSKEQKGPVTTLCSVLGYLLVGMGQKVYIWQFKDNDLVGISFLDMQLYTLHMVSMRSIVVVGDAFRSVSMLRYQEYAKALSMAARDTRPMEVYGVEFVVDNKQLGFLVSDKHGNIFIYMYQPEAKESAGGTKLLRRADMNIGTRVCCFYRVKSHVSDPIVDHKIQAANRHIVLYASLDGALGYIMPLPEKTYRRLFMLQNVLTSYVFHHAGLNPRSYRSAKQDEPMLQNSQKNILDGDLIRLYNNLSYPEKLEVAKRIGTSREQISDDLLEIQRMATHY